MKLPSSDYQRLHARLHEVWLEINRATDTPDCHVSIDHLAKALQSLIAVGRALHAPDTSHLPDDEVLAYLTDRYHHSVLGSESTPKHLRTLRERLTRVQTPPAPATANQGATEWDPLVINASIPALWRSFHGLRRELRRHRPLSDYGHTLLKVCAGTLVLGAILYSLALVVPWGAWVVYYRGTDLKWPVGVAMEPKIFKDYSEGRPCLLGTRNKWSSRWTACLRVPRPGAYSFYVQRDGGIRFWIDDRLVLDAWQEQDWQHSGQEVTLDLTQGDHRLRIEHFKRYGNGALRMRWVGGGIPANTTIGIPYLFKY